MSVSFSGRFFHHRLHFSFSDLLLLWWYDRNDIRTRSKYYKSDWTDAFSDMNKVIPAVLFLYFACLSPAVSFGTIASQITDGSIGIVEFLVSCGGSGMVRLNSRTIAPQIPARKVDGYNLMMRWSLMFSKYSSQSYFSAAICHLLWTANVIHCPNRAHTGIYFRSVPILCSEGTTFLSGVHLGWIMDFLLLCFPWTCRIQCTYPLLYKIHRRSIQRTPQRQFYLRSCFVAEKKFSTCRSHEFNNAICVIIDGNVNLFVDNGGYCFPK